MSPKRLHISRLGYTRLSKILDSKMQPSPRLKDGSRRCVIESQNIGLLRIQRYYLYNAAFSGALVQGEMSLSRGKVVSDLGRSSMRRRDVPPLQSLS